MRDEFIDVAPSNFYLLAGLVLMALLAVALGEGHRVIRGRPTARQAVVALSVAAAGVVGLVACLAQLADPFSVDDIAFVVAVAALAWCGVVTVLAALTRLLTGD